MKRARPGKSKGKQPAAGDGELGFEEARELQAVITSGGRLSDGELLRVLKADKPCEALYSKACKASEGAAARCSTRLAARRRRWRFLPPARLPPCLPACACAAATATAAPSGVPHS
jgi:hypothetical protein